MEPIQQAACYIRVSTEDQTEYSPEAQRRALEHYARQHGFAIAPEHVYLDAGISGRRAETRPAFMAMIAAAKAKPPPFSAILVHKFDRFARNREDSIVYKSLLRRQCGVQVISITEHLEDDRMGLILEAMLEAMAEYYSLNLAEEVRKGMVEKARRGELQTAPPFGYRVAGHALVPVPEEARVVRELYRRFLAGESLAALARWTQQLGARTHRGNFLDSRRVRYILTNPVYRGVLRWHPQGRGRGEALEVPGAHPPLVSQADFQAVGERLAAFARRTPKHARPWGDRKHWLAGLAKCAACGGGLVFAKPHYLKCGRYGKGKCPCSQHVPAEELERAVLDRLRADCAWAGAFAVLPAASEEQKTRQALSRELAALGRREQRLREAYLCGAEALPEYRRAKEALQAQQAALRQRQAALEQTDPGQAQARWDTVLATLEDPLADTQAKHRAAQSILADCRWDRASRTVCLTYRLKL